MNYRCVKSNDSSEVIAIGYDEGQANQNYNDVGTWQDFTFSEMPVIIQEVQDYAVANNFMGSLYKVVDGVMVSKTLVEIQ
jgi:hypothetical protein